jgi:ATP synthase protein I
MAISRENIRLIGQLSTIGFSFVLAIVMGFGGGYLIDRWLGTSPWLTFLGFFAGLAAGVLNVYRVMKFAASTTRPTPPEHSTTAGAWPPETPPRAHDRAPRTPPRR